MKGIYVCGSTGEGMSLTSAERREVAEAYIAAARGRLPVIVQVGHNSLAEARALAQHAQAAGADAVSAMEGDRSHGPYGSHGAHQTLGLGGYLQISLPGLQRRLITLNSCSTRSNDSQFASRALTLWPRRGNLLRPRRVNPSHCTSPKSTLSYLTRRLSISCSDWSP